MKCTGLFIALVLLCPALAPAASKEMIELQRDVAQLQDQVRDLQRSFDERFSALQVLVQQTLDASNKSNAALDAQSRNEQGMADRVAAPIAGLNSKVDAMGGDVSGMREAVSDLTARLTKVQQQLTDLGNVVKAGQLPVAAPPPTTGAPTPDMGAGAPPPTYAPAGGAPAGGAPPVPATVLYESAFRDMQSGKADLALGEFQDYIRYYNDTDAAPAAQFYIGQIHASQSQFDQAIQDFDRVLEAYPNNSKTADAHYQKGKTLFQLGQRNAAVKEFESVLNDFPRSSVAPQARAQLKALGINPPGAAPVRRKS
jgi:TolA-binding protein